MSATLERRRSIILPMRAATRGSIGSLHRTSRSFNRFYRPQFQSCVNKERSYRNDPKNRCFHKRATLRRRVAERTLFTRQTFPNRRKTALAPRSYNNAYRTILISFRSFARFFYPFSTFFKKSKRRLSSFCNITVIRILQSRRNADADSAPRSLILGELILSSRDFSVEYDKGFRQRFSASRRRVDSRFSVYISLRAFRVAVQ